MCKNFLCEKDLYVKKKNVNEKLVCVCKRCVCVCAYKFLFVKAFVHHIIIVIVIAIIITIKALRFSGHAVVCQDGPQHV